MVSRLNTMRSDYEVANTIVHDPGLVLTAIGEDISEKLETPRGRGALLGDVITSVVSVEELLIARLGRMGRYVGLVDEAVEGTRAISLTDDVVEAVSDTRRSIAKLGLIVPREGLDRGMDFVSREMSRLADEAGVAARLEMPPHIVTADELVAEAALRKPGFDQATTDIAEAVGGRKKLGPAKTEESIVRKADDSYGGDIRQTKDPVRNSIVFDDMSTLYYKAEDVKQLFKEQGYELVEIKDGFAKPSAATNYRDLKMFFRDKDNMPFEVQLHTETSFEAKLAEEANQVEIRKIDKDLKEMRSSGANSAAITEKESERAALLDDSRRIFNEAEETDKALDPNIDLLEQKWGQDSLSSKLLKFPVRYDGFDLEKCA